MQYDTPRCIKIDSSDSFWNQSGFNSILTPRIHLDTALVSTQYEREICYLESLLWYWNQCGFKMNPRCQLVWNHGGFKINPKCQFFPAIGQLKNGLMALPVSFLVPGAYPMPNSTVLSTRARTLPPPCQQVHVHATCVGAAAGAPCTCKSWSLGSIQWN